VSERTADGERGCLGAAVVSKGYGRLNEIRSEDGSNLYLRKTHAVR